MPHEIPIDASLELTRRERRVLGRVGLHRWLLPAAVALGWVLFWLTAWYRVSKILGVGVPGLRTLGDLLSLEVKSGTTYDAFHVFAITTMDQIANDFRVALVLSVVALGVYVQSGITLKLWRAFRTES